jgi:hypothetical protein
MVDAVSAIDVPALRVGNERANRNGPTDERGLSFKMSFVRAHPRNACKRDETRAVPPRRRE